MSDLAWNVWGAVAGAVGILLAVLPLFYIWLYRQLPHKRFAGLVALMEETKELFSIALRERFITDERDLAPLRLNILAAIIRVERVRRRVYAERSFLANVKHWWRGLSRQMYFLEDELNNLLVKLAEWNSKERETRASQGLADELLFFSENKENIPLMPSAIPGDRQGRQRSESTASEDPMRQSLDYAVFFGGAFLLPKLADFHPAQTHRPIHHMISETDLQSLLFLALAPHTQTEEDQHERVVQQEVLHHLNKQMHGLDLSSAWGGDAMFLKRTAKRSTRFKSLARFLRRVYGVGPPGIDGGALDASIDPESLLPTSDGSDDEGDEEWDSDDE